MKLTHGARLCNVDVKVMCKYLCVLIFLIEFILLCYRMFNNNFYKLVHLTIQYVF
jgi:hypothetical protein